MITRQIFERGQISERDIERGERGGRERGVKEEEKEKGEECEEEGGEEEKKGEKKVKTMK